MNDLARPAPRGTKQSRHRHQPARKTETEDLHVLCDPVCMCCATRLASGVVGRGPRGKHWHRDGVRGLPNELSITNALQIHVIDWESLPVPVSASAHASVTHPILVNLQLHVYT